MRLDALKGIKSEEGGIVVGSIAAWIKGHSIASVVAAIFLGVGMGAAGATGSGQQEIDELKAERDALEAQLKDHASESGELQSAVGRAEGQAAEAEKRAAEAESQAEAKLEERLDRELEEIRELRAQFRQGKRQLDEREAKIARAERLAERSTFSDGVWQVGSEIPAGIYRAPAGSRCYWAILGSAETDNILNNGGFTANQTVTLRAGNWFESSNCGRWKKVG